MQMRTFTADMIPVVYEAADCFAHRSSEEDHALDVNFDGLADVIRLLRTGADQQLITS